MTLAHTDEIVSTHSMDMDWGSPLGIALFLIGATLAFFLFSLAVKNFTEVEAKTSKKNKK